MNVPPSNHPVWRDLLSGKVKHECDFLAAKLLLGTLARKLANDRSERNLERCTAELREFFAKNADQPTVQKDLRKIFG